MTATTHFINAQYRTHDLPLAAFLVTQGHVLLRLEGEYRKSFVFSGDAAADADRFYDGATVCAMQYGHALRDLKGRLYSA
jgi:hypothetical protein